MILKAVCEIGCVHLVVTGTCMMAMVMWRATAAVESRSCRKGNERLFQSAMRDAHSSGTMPASSPLEPATWTPALCP